VSIHNNALELEARPAWRHAELDGSEREKAELESPTNKAELEGSRIERVRRSIYELG
jgi:hypothetical protein